MWKLMYLVILVNACGFSRPRDVSPGDNPGDDEDMQDGGQPVDPGGGVQGCTRTTCTGDRLEVCGASGTIERTEQCALGCLGDGSRCNEVSPSNGLSSAIDQAKDHAEIVLPSGSVIDTDSGVVMAAGTPILVATTTVTQPGGPVLRVLLARAWTIRDVRIRGTLPVAFVASDEIEIQGVVDASADGDHAGPGAPGCVEGGGAGGIAGPGLFERPRPGASPGYPDFLWVSNGHGGGGFGTVGGAGGLSNSQQPVGPGGATNGNPELIPLRGGCQGGGSALRMPPPHLGAGGGAAQIVSGRSVHILAGGVLHVGGGQGAAGILGTNDINTTDAIYSSAGGGSGGGILIEAPGISIDDGAALLAAGGGGGGYGACSPGPDGADAEPRDSAAAGGTCPAGVTPTAAGGAGAWTGDSGPGDPAISRDNGSAGSGGGGLGRIRINTADGTFAAGAGAVIRGVATTGMVGRR